MKNSWLRKGKNKKKIVNSDACKALLKLSKQRKAKFVLNSNAGKHFNQCQHETCVWQTVQLEHTHISLKIPTIRIGKTAVTFSSPVQINVNFGRMPYVRICEKQHISMCRVRVANQRTHPTTFQNDDHTARFIFNII